MSNFLKKIYLFKFFDDLILIYPLYAVMFADFGLSTLQISILFIVWSSTAFLLEVPSGVLADKYSRKKILILAQLIRAVGYAIWALLPSFTGFLSGFIFWGIKSALTSGTFEALLYDELIQAQKEDDYVEIIGKTKSLSHLAILISSLGASAAILLGYGFVLVLSVIAVVVAAVTVSFLPEARPIESTHEKEYFSILKQGLTISFRSPWILKTTLFIGLVVGLSGDMEEYWPLFLGDLGLPRHAFGVIFAGFGLAQIIGSLVAYKFKNWSSLFHYLLIMLAGLLLLIAAFLMELVSLALISLFILLFELVGVVFEGRLQDLIPSKARATISSVKGFFVNVSALVVYALFGLIASRYANRGSFVFFGATAVILTALFMIFDKLSFKASQKRA